MMEYDSLGTQDHPKGGGKQKEGLVRDHSERKFNEQVSNIADLKNGLTGNSVLKVIQL